MTGLPWAFVSPFCDDLNIYQLNIHAHVPRVAGIRIKTQGGIEVQILTDWANSSQPLTRDARLECEAFPATEPMLI